MDILRYNELYSEYMKMIKDIQRKVKYIERFQKRKERRAKEATDEEIEKLKLYEKDQDLDIKKYKIYNLPDNEVFIGQVANGYMDGVGKYIFNDNSEYIGEFKESYKEL